MKVLWITNILFPYPSAKLNIEPPVGGGWMLASAYRLSKQQADMQLAIATVYKGREIKKYEEDNIIYYLLPLKGNNTQYNKQLENLWRFVTDDFKPNLVHIHGTEFAHGLAFINACSEIRTVVSIQGLVSVISKYYYSGIKIPEIIKNLTLRDIVRRDSIIQQKWKLYKRGLIETEILKKSSDVIGRTSWDKSHVLSINPNLRYHFCNETLREEFYHHTWNYNNCEKHSIFVSQAWYPIKGLHKLLEAMPLILRGFPDAKVYVAGTDITKMDNFTDRIRLSGYGKYIRSLITKFNLSGKVIFCGSLNEMEMCQQYLKANVFVCPSSIENSPNSLGEAQMLGVPYLSAYVGGAPDMVSKQNDSSLYRFEEIEQLAYKICTIFNKKGCANTINERNLALERHDPILNTRQLLKIYNSITEL